MINWKHFSMGNEKINAIDFGGLHIGFETRLCIDNDNLVGKTPRRNFPKNQK